jgi:hypothetical protein
LDARQTTFAGFARQTHRSFRAWFAREAWFAFRAGYALQTL